MCPPRAESPNASTAWTSYGVTQADVAENRDKTTNYGVYYVFQNDSWHFSGEAITGLLGRRFATIGSGTSTTTYANNPTTNVVTATTTTTYGSKREHTGPEVLRFRCDWRLHPRSAHLPGAL